MSIQNASSEAKWGKRATLRCPKCGLVQFWPENKEKCVRPGCNYAIRWRLTARLELAPEAPRKLPQPARMFDARALGKRIKALRQARKLSQRDLARLMNCQRTYVSRRENGRGVPYPQQVVRFAAALGVKPPHLLDERIRVQHLTAKTPEEVTQIAEAQERWEAELGAAIAALPRSVWPVVIEIARQLAAGQYSFQDWMTV
jgi:transcriptional regulator with XRE-family HTH domain